MTFGGAGFELAHFMLGLDFRLSESFGLGPVIDLSLAQFSSASIEYANGSRQDGTLADKALHEWLLLGLRGVFCP